LDAAGLAPANRLAQTYRQREATTALAWRDGGRLLRLGANLVELREDFGSADFDTGATRLAAASTIRKEALSGAAELPLGAGRLELGLRRDLQRYSAYRVFDSNATPPESAGGGVLKSATSPRLALAWPIGEGYRLRGSVGTGFSPPQASQLYNGYTSAGTVTLANPALKPERSTTADLALSGHPADGEWSLTLFATRWQDKISTRILDYGTPSVQQPQNVGLSTARGIEAQWSGRLARDWSLAANYTYTRTRIEADLSDPALVGHELPDMPRHKANLSLGWEPGDGFTARGVLRGVGPAHTDEANTLVDADGHRWKKAGYTLLDLAATWRRPGHEFTLALANVFDRDYVTGFFWHGEPRTLRGELTIRF
ncbi:MAG: TonB-dependent receptor, partial [Zoogloea sp.]|nr:TonB-dependent receptor [Zoogloea sp.]